MMIKTNGEGVMIDFGLPFILKNYLAQMREESVEEENLILEESEKGEINGVYLKKRVKADFVCIP